MPFANAGHMHMTYGKVVSLSTLAQIEKQQNDLKTFKNFRLVCKSRLDNIKKTQNELKWNSQQIINN